MKKPSSRDAAFTLIELSIVLAVIGLIFASVVSGNALVRQAQLRSIIADYRAYDVAINNFKGTYGQLPGDFDSAYSYWGSDCAASTAACNGDGDSFIVVSGGNGRKEMFNAFKHLSLAGLIPGSFTGTSVLANNETTPGLNTPEGKLSQSEWILSNPEVYYTTYNTISIGRHNTYQASYNEAVLLSPLDTKALDQKTDDGIPTLGILRAINGVLSASSASTLCYSGTGTSGVYGTVITSECTLYFSMTASPYRW